MTKFKGNEEITIVIPVYNELPYTVNCLESMGKAGISDSQIVVVNNGSTDGTTEFLAGRPQIRAIHNAENRGCGFAWTQGAKISTATWIVIMNNDVLVPAGCIEGLIHFAEGTGIDVASPAMCEGEMDYDFSGHAAGLMARMKDAYRREVAHGVCFMVHRRVFEGIGYFDGDPRLGGYEDDEFFRRARRAGFHLAITGRAFIHHFGGTTQKSIKATLNSGQRNKSLGDRTYYRKKTGQTWPKRKYVQLKSAIRGNWWRFSETQRFGQTLISRRQNGKWQCR